MLGIFLKSFKSFTIFSKGLENDKKTQFNLMSYFGLISKVLDKSMSEKLFMKHLTDDCPLTKKLLFKKIYYN